MKFMPTGGQDIAMTGKQVNQGNCWKWLITTYIVGQVIL